MALVSTRAQLLKKRVAAVTVFIGLSSVSCFGQPVFLTVSSTPYDHQMSRVHPVLTSTNVQLPGPTSSLFAVNQWMTELRAIPYRYSTYWQTPGEVDLEQAADCKGKAVALYAEMRRNGAKNVRVVIGKRHIYSPMTHAWLEWETKEGSYVLDPTFNEMPIKTAEISPMTYIPLYAYDGEHKYRAAEASSVAATSKVEPGYRNRFYAPTRARSTYAQSGLTRIGARHSFAATTGYATLSTGLSQLGHRYSWSNARHSALNVQALHQAGVPAAAPASGYVIRDQPTPVSRQGPATRNSRRRTSDPTRFRQVQNSIGSQNLEYVMQTRLRMFPPQL
jgi:hypothetical protein